MLCDIAKKEFKKKGIYRILNTANGKSYIGSTSTGFRHRFTKHKSELTRGVHPSHHLMNAYAKGKPEDFVYSILEVVRLSISMKPETIKRKLIESENFYINKFKSNYRKHGYNQRSTADTNFGISHHADAKTRIKGRSLSDETKYKMSQSRQGELHPSAKLTVADVKKIKILIEKGYRNINIASQFRISKSIINDIKRGATWPHVTLSKNDYSKFGEISVESQNKTFLDDDEVLAILFLSYKGYSIPIISKGMSVKSASISDIRSGNTYSNVSRKLNDISKAQKSLNLRIFDALKLEHEKKLANKRKAARQLRRRIGGSGIGQKNPSSILNDKQVLRIAHRLKNGENQNTIAKQYGVTPDCIARIKNGHNWSHITGFRKKALGKPMGEKHGNAVHSDNTVRKIIRLHKSGLTTKEICEKLKLEKTFVNRVKSGKTRSHITGIKTK